MSMTFTVTEFRTSAVKTLSTALVAGLLLLSASTGAADSLDCDGSQPWTKLQFEQKSLWVTARSEVSLKSLCGVDAQAALAKNVAGQAAPEVLWKLTAKSSVASSLEQLELLMSASDARIFYKQRFSKGKNRRVKDYIYGKDRIARRRRDPTPEESTLEPAQWSQLREQQIQLTPQQAAASPLTASYALLVLASDEALRKTGSSKTVYLHTDYNFYRVGLHNRFQETLDSDFTLNGKPISAAARQASHIEVIATPLGPLADKPDFELLGFESNIAIHIDHRTGLPLRVSGKAPRVGRTEANLVAAQE